MNFSLPAGAINDIASSSSSFISGVAPVATLLIGILLAFFIIEFIISTIRQNENK